MRVEPQDRISVLIRDESSQSVPLPACTQGGYVRTCSKTSPAGTLISGFQNYEKYMFAV